MSASKVYFTDMRCPVGTGLLDKLKREYCIKNVIMAYSS